ncbi:MAG: LCP family protein [Actinomycetota bacterium]|nr:LCP family protein [Actinomycetota bacterium]
MSGVPDRRRRMHRSTAQRVVIIGAAFAALASFAGAAALAGGQYVVGQRRIVDIEDPSARIAAGGTTTTTTTTTTTAVPPSAPDITVGNVLETTPTPDETDTTTTTTKATFPAADPEAKNFLITGADNNSCIDPNSPIGRSIGQREGERSDTIVIWRVDPATSRAAVLSLPRDLWVSIPNAGFSRINSAYRRDDPQLLIDTIYANFGIGINHFVQVDFCAFKTIVDAVGGVSVPFEFPTRDTGSGLNVTEPGCFEFDGETALGYVRSRRYEYLPAGADPATGWKEDFSSDLGRVSRQQDFQRRMLAKVAKKGALNPSVARALIRATTDYVVTDDALSPNKLLEFAGVLREVRPEGIPNYQVTAEAATISGNDVLLPQIDNERMQEVLSLFRGELSLQQLPADPTPTTTSPSAATSTTVSNTSTTTNTTTTTTTVPDTPVVTASGWAPTPPTPPGTTPTSIDPSTPKDIEFGIVPPADVTCD